MTSGILILVGGPILLTFVLSIGFIGEWLMEITND